MEHQVLRQVLHMIIGAAVIVGLLLVPRPLSLIILFGIFLIAVLLSLLSRKWKIPGVNYFLSTIGKEDEKKFPGKGFIFFLAGCLIAVKLFPIDIALAAIVVLTFGDSIANLTRKLLVRKSKRLFKNFKGSIVGLVVSFFVALLFVPVAYAGVAAVIGMLSESVAIKLGEGEADDNLIIPLAAGTALYVLRFVFGV
ncbi:MAG: hypothetical protein JSW08_03180 [archaeon]|nr:MAG: hypothetical protein JSW08_03180 [archaeon]